jgi:hypothetical protein
VLYLRHRSVVLISNGSAHVAQPCPAMTPRASVVRLALHLPLALCLAPHIWPAR